MPLWGWVLLIGCLSALLVIAVLAIVRSTHRLPASEPLHGDADELSSPMPLHVAEADSMTERELEAERERSERSRAAISPDR